MHQLILGIVAIALVIAGAHRLAIAMRVKESRFGPHRLRIFAARSKDPTGYWTIIAANLAAIVFFTWVAYELLSTWAAA